MFKLVQPHLNGLQLRDARTSEVERVLRAVADSKERAKTTLSNARNFLSGAFRYAIRTDRFSRENPVREAKVPKGKRPQSVPAYSLEDITAMVNAVNEPAKTTLLVAGLSGLRDSQVCGLKWEDFTGDESLCAVTHGGTGEVMQAIPRPSAAPRLCRACRCLSAPWLRIASARLETALFSLASQADR